MEETNNRGLIEALTRIMRELIKKPTFKESLRAILRHLDPASGRGLVRTLLWQDPDLSLSLAAALPKLINLAINIGDEVLRQLSDKISPAVFRDFMASLLKDLDREALDSLLRNAQKMRQDLTPLFREIVSDRPTAAEEK